MPFVDGRVLVEPIDAVRWRLHEDVSYAGERDTFTVPAGYVTDFATVPRIAVWLIPRFGNYTRAAILHDWLLTDSTVHPRDIDGLFRRAMRELGVPAVRRWLMWTGVRWGALFNRRRRAGWWKDAPAVLALSIIFLPLAIPMIVDAIGLAYYGALELAVSGKAGSLQT